MVRVRLFIEGGGQGSRLNRLFRTAWHDFFLAAGLHGNLPRIVRGGSRNETFEQFMAAVKEARPGELPILLVDSEGPVDVNHSAWQHLRHTDRWERPAGTREEQAFLMIQVMETWFLADRGALQNYFGSSFQAGRLPRQRELESIPKDAVLQSLAAATADCNKRYGKGIVSFEILGRVNPVLVAENCPGAKSLLECLRAL